VSLPPAGGAALTRSPRPPSEGPSPATTPRRPRWTSTILPASRR